MRPGGKTRRKRASAGPYSSTHRATRSWLKLPLAPCTCQGITFVKVCMTLLVTQHAKKGWGKDEFISPQGY